MHGALRRPLPLTPNPTPSPNPTPHQVPYDDVKYDLEVLKEDVMADLTKLAKAASEVNGGVQPLP